MLGFLDLQDIPFTLIFHPYSINRNKDTKKVYCLDKEEEFLKIIEENTQIKEN